MKIFLKEYLLSKLFEEIDDKCFTVKLYLKNATSTFIKVFLLQPSETLLYQIELIFNLILIIQVEFC